MAIPVILTTAATTSIAFAAANPFSDVPSDSWAYDAVSQLAKDGVIDGYPDNTYRGQHNMTRFEMAQIVAKAMARTDLDKADKATVDKLAAEFSEELSNLGVRVSDLEKKSDNIKWSGKLKYKYKQQNHDVGKDKRSNKIELRTVNNEVYTFNLSVNEAPEIVEYRALEWHEWLWKWFSILFNYEVGYTTESFWDFGTRCGYIAEVYSTGQIKVVGDNDTTESDGSTNEDVENKVIIEALSYQLCSIEQSDLQSIYYEKGHIYLIPKETYEDDGDQAILITDKVSFSDNYLNELVANEFDVVLVLEDSAPSDMMFTKYGVSFVVIETDNTYTANDFKMEVNNEFI